MCPGGGAFSAVCGVSSTLCKHDSRSRGPRRASHSRCNPAEMALLCCMKPGDPEISSAVMHVCSPPVLSSDLRFHVRAFGLAPFRKGTGRIYCLRVFALCMPLWQQLLAVMQRGKQRRFMNAELQQRCENKGLVAQAARKHSALFWHTCGVSPHLCEDKQ